MARDLKKTRAQLLDEISALEMVWWRALYEQEAREREAESEKQSRRR